MTQTSLLVTFFTIFTRHANLLLIAIALIHSGMWSPIDPHPLLRSPPTHILPANTPIEHRSILHQVRL